MSYQSLNAKSYDLAIVGGGVLGLAHAYLAARKGLKVILLERDGAANGASVRNFGFVTVTGQQRGAFYDLARRSRAIWQEAVTDMGLHVQHQGLYMCVRHEESVAVLEAFMQTEMAEGCRILTPSETPIPLQPNVLKVLHSSHEVRVESREVIPQIVRVLSERYNVDFCYHCTALEITDDQIYTTRGLVRAKKIVVCQGDNLSGLFADRLAKYEVNRCKLQMLRLASPGFTLPGAIMSDLGLIRYLGYSELAEAEALKSKLMHTQAAHIAAGIHLIVVQGSDGSVVVGDSHVYGTSLDPFGDDRVDSLILDEYAQIMGAPPKVLERWIGTYAVSDKQHYFIDRPNDNISHVVVTCGAGATTSMAIAEQSLISLGIDIHDHITA